MINWNESDLNRALKNNPSLRVNQKHSQPVKKSPGPTKYRNKKVIIDGIKFDSLAEADRWSEIQLLIRIGEIKAAERQKRFILPGGIVYILDHFITQKNGIQEAEEVKGYWTRESINKCKQFVEIYGYPLFIIHKGQRIPWEEMKFRKVK